MKTISTSLKKQISFVFFLLFSFLANAQNGYFQNFTAPGVPSAFTWETSYAVSVKNQALEVIVNKANLFHGVTVTFPTALNLSVNARKKVSFRIKTDTTTRKIPYEIGLAFFNAGATNQVGGRRTNKIIYPTGKWQTVSFDFNDAGFTPHNFSAVTQLNITFQPMGYMQGNTKVQIDDLAVGNNGVVGQAAIVSPYFTGIENQEISINTTTSVSIRNAVDSDNLNSNVTFTAASSNTSILPNPTFQTSPILSNSYFSFTSGNGSTGDLQTNRVIKMLMTPNTNQSGMVTVTITATAASQVGATSVPYRYIINVNVKPNIAPTIGTIPTSLTIGSNRKTDIFLDNIVSGNGEVTQILSISGLSSDQTILQNSQIVASYNGISLSAKLSITPIQFSSPASKIFNLTVTVSDNGGIVAGGSDRTSYVIPITVLPTFYNAPTIGVIPNQIDNIITQGPRTIRIEPITDGNGGSRIASVTAVSGNTGILANPTVSYTTGNNFALLTYNSLLVGTTDISVTATNFGAPANSNGNSSFTRSFVMKALNPPQAGYIEPMTVQTIVGAPLNPGTQADGRFSTVAGTWFVENQGTQQTVTINTTTGVMSISMNKDGTAPGYFSGVWYKPYGGGELFDFATSPYISVKLSATNPANLPNLGVAIDLWDVNGYRYGLEANVQVTPTATTYTFCYTGSPCAFDGQPWSNCGGNGRPEFNFSKIKTILFNFGQTVSAIGTGTFTPYSGTITMSDLRLGSDAVGSGSCTLPVPNVVFGETPNPFHLTTQTGPKTVTITGINAGSTPITGKNNNPVNLSAAGTFSPSVLSFNTTTGVAIIQYTTGGAASGVITLTGVASGSNTKTKTFTVTVQAPPSSQNVIVTNDLNANFADGFKGQTIDGSPFGVCEIFGDDGGTGFTDSYYENLKDVGIKSMRVGIWDFEPKNDNNDPFVLDKTKLDYTAMGVDFFKKAKDAGVERFLVTFFSPPSFVKYNNSYGVPNAPFEFAPGFVVTNTVDSTYYEEYAEYAVAFVQGLREKSGVEVWGLSIGNEIQFNQAYQSVVYTTSQYVEIVRRVGRRLAAAGLKTFIWGAETLQGQDSGNDYLKACQADPEVRNYFAGYAIHAYAANGVGQAAPSWGNVVIDSRDTRSNGGLALMRQSVIATVGPGGEQHNGNGGPGIPIYQTETSQGGVTNFEGWDNAMGIFAGVSTSLSVGKNSGWYYIGIGKSAKMYYTYKHMDKFVFGGARHIPVTQPVGTNVNAFRNPDGSVCVMLANDNTGMRTFSFGGVNMPTANRAYLSVDNLFWKDLGTITGNISVPPNAMLTLWGGGNALVAASGVTVTGANSTNVAGGLIQFNETVLPAILVDKSVTWSVITLTGNAIINQSGLMTAVSNGTVRIRATSVATPTVFGELVVTISGQYVPVTSITVDGLGGVRSVAPSATLQMTVTGVLPLIAPVRDASWTLNPASGIASINSNGLLTGISAGRVTVIGTSLDNLTVTSRVVVTVTSSSVAITSATVTGGTNQITTGGGTLAMTSTFSPANATSTTVGWSISGSIASINPTTGLVTALNSGNGVITVTSTYAAWGISATRVITISGQTSLITSATINGMGGSSVINTANGSLQMTVTGFLPIDATNTTPTWSLLLPNLGNSINSSGLLSATTNSNGVITVQAAFGSVLARRIITISGQNIPVTAAVINGLGNVSVINTANGTLQMTTTGITPVNANQNIIPTWSLLTPNLGNSINASGLLSATTNSNGVITVQAAFGSVLATRIITVSGQNIPVTSAVVNGIGGISVINTANGTLQMTTTGITPVNANQNIVPTWSLLLPNLGNSINTSGLLSATNNSNGVITVQAAFGSVLATRTITVSGQNVPVTAAVINGVGGISSITTNLGILQLTTTGLTPANANQNTTPVWSLIGGNSASLNASTGILTAINNGNVTVQAAFGSVLATRVITVSNQLTGISITASSSTITTNVGTLQMQLSYIPTTASVSGVNWSTNNANASVNSTGLVSALLNGNVTVTATSVQNNSFVSRYVVTITNQAASFVPVSSVSLSGTQTIISTGSTSISASVLPANATNPAVSWSVFPSSGIASIGATTSNSVVLNGVGNGVVTLTGTSVSTSSVTGIRTITVSGFAIPVTSATVNGTGGVNQITASNGTLQMLAPYSPANANSNTTLVWSMSDPTNKNLFNISTGVLTAQNDGNGLITITGSYGAVVSRRVVTVSGQGITATSMTVNGVNITTQSGTTPMSVVFNPSNANVGTSVGWTSSNASIASVNPSTGIVSAVTNGIVTITGTAGSLTAIKSITISGQFVGIPVTSTTINGMGGVNQITVANGTLQMLAPYFPTNANQNTTLGWSMSDPTNKNSLNASTGLLQANTDGNGTVTITGSYGAVTSKRVVTISGQGITATSMTVNGANISVLNGTSQMTAIFGPVGANVGTNVTWSSTPIGRVNGTGLVSANGLNEVITVTGNTGSLSSIKVLTISGQIISVNSISISGSNTISAAGGAIFLNSLVLPSNASIPTIIWSVLTSPGEGIATVNNSGTVIAQRNGNGVITIVGTSTDGSGVKGYFPVTISGQEYDVLGLSIASQNGNFINVAGGTILISSTFVPVNATDKFIEWSVLTVPGQGMAKINSSGFLTALESGNGLVTVVGASVSNPLVSSSLVITISGQVVPITNVLITSSGLSITTNGGISNIGTSFLPLDATGSIVVRVFPRDIVSVNATSTEITAIDNGIVTITASSFSNPSISAILVYTITGQYAKQVTISGFGGSNNLNTIAGTLQMEATSPQVNALPQAIVWSILSQKPTNPVYNGKDLVSINSITGLVSSLNYSNGLVTVSGFFPNSSITSIVVITVSNQREPALLATSGNTFMNLTYPGHSFTATGVVLPSTATDRSLIWEAIGAGKNLVIVNSLTGFIEASDAGKGLVTILGYSASDQNLTFTNVISVSGNSSELRYDLKNLDGDNVLPILNQNQDQLIIISKFFPEYDGLPNLLTRGNFVNFSATPPSALTVSSDGSVQIVPGTTDLKGFVTLTYQRNPLLELTIEFDINTTSIISTENVVSSVKISPVPFENVLTIKNLKVGDKLFVYNSKGALMLNLVANETMINLDTKDFSIGFYSIVVISEGKSTTLKVSK
ncbi:MAG: hypothetical protein EAZ27_04590 [Cytophagales bacterium]|nr:MAG: hypothetical protein EAZ27_04590 [Cytophagales bacterium]